MVPVEIVDRSPELAEIDLSVEVVEVEKVLSVLLAVGSPILRSHRSLARVISFWNLTI